MMIARTLALALLLLALWAAPGGAKERFFASLEDLPLMAGLSEVAELGLVYDKPEGRIVEAYARGRVAPARVLEFYAETLPQLGWTAQSKSQYRRESETLIIRFPQPAGDDGLLVRFSIAPG
ncbi:MAG TPA: hypothetical protein QGF63_09040 [Alphaproteobacteria bacterium]|jgi:hypothetical protein|nr:hypothetical protein [Alphaproteobacteria bacterium]MDP7164176.1 hypothetical protein [Alphaproteobacteria bacterium]MDP7426760.1 hypothetical protein [Alphaproteobacteria bacterium]HJM49982.1 hypothetical protein [Alphaproteobacteria bacterium]